MLTNFDHVTVVVRDLTAARRFFEVLGFREEQSVVISGEPFEAYMGVPGIEADHVTLVLEGASPRAEIQLLRYRQPEVVLDPDAGRLDKVGFNHVCFAVTDLDAMVERLEAAGFRLRSGVMDFHQRKLAFVYGPEGITIELAQWHSLPARRASASQRHHISEEIDPMNPNKALWEKGDFTRVAASMRESGEELVDRLGITKGLEVLDLGCGDGTTAVPAARRGAKVLGVDIARNLVEAGNRRAREAGLTNLRFQEGDASDLRELHDQSFDLVVSIFGAMFAPRPFDVAREMVRVTRPGGRIVMGNWIPGDPTLVAQILRISSAYSPPPPEGFVSPMTWGIERDVVERFVAAGVPEGRVSFARETFVFHAPVPPSQFLASFRAYYGPTMNAFEAAEASGRADELFRELEGLFDRQNLNPNKRATSIPATFLRVTVQR